MNKLIKKKIPKKYKEDIETLRYRGIYTAKLFYPTGNIVRKLKKRFGEHVLGFLVKIEKIEYTR